MHYELCQDPFTSPTHCLVIGCFEEEKTSIAVQFDRTIAQLREDKLFTGKLGKSINLCQLPDCPAKMILLVGCGEQAKYNTTAFAKVIKQVASELVRLNVASATIHLPELVAQSKNWELMQSIISFELSDYAFNQLKSKPQPPSQLSQLKFYSTKLDQQTFDLTVTQGQAITAGMRLCRDLGNTPSNICTPNYLAETALNLAKTYPQIKTTVLEEADMEELGMHALLAVAKGSEQRAKLVTLNYQGGASQQAPVVLVGKGITFDSGGISIKPAAAMDEMKYDMCGAASVLGVLQAVAQLQLPINIVGVLACAENLPSGQATKPGDIVTTHAGLSVEILNTDAEGRLVLCDALSYVAKFNPKIVLDIATLTGAMIFALGHHITGVLGNDEALLQELINAGQAIDDKAWPLPITDEYQEMLETNFADIANIGNDRSAGAITAACFLSRFTEKYRWAHLDIAGTAWVSGKNKGATGRPIPLLMQFLINQVTAGNGK